MRLVARFSGGTFKTGIGADVVLTIIINLIIRSRGVKTLAPLTFKNNTELWHVQH
jgi:hypothetical protein